MSTMSLRLPDSMHRRLKEWARKDNISVNQFITSAVTEKLAALSTLEYLEERAARADRTRFEAALAKVPDVEPAPEDRWK
ncbi:MAG: toxin-antitoxin system HicB family antitoxin [Pseudoxanthomonas sp.]